MKSERAWFSELAAKLGPEDSVGSYLARTAGAAGLRSMLAHMSDVEVSSLIYDLDFWARRQQVPPDTLWETCIILAGRGFGKTFAGARWAIRKAQKAKTRGALVAPTAGDIRDTMIEGESGIAALSPPWFRPKYEPSKRRLTWPNGIRATGYSADKPDRLRGPNCGWGWGDEPASWKHEMAALDQLGMVLRKGEHGNPPQLFLTGTPTPVRKLVELVNKPGVVVIRGSSLANAANLAPTTVANMRALANTRWGRQEVLGELLLDVPGAIFGSAKWGRVAVPDESDPMPFRLAFAKQLDRRVVSVDPAPTSESGSDETGIIVSGTRDVDGLKRVFVLNDSSGRMSPREWAAAAIREYLAFQCDAIVVEVNTGGEMVRTTIETVAAEMGVQVVIKDVRAREHKTKRAEPVAALAESGRIEFVGPFPKLEKQLATFTGINGRRDDRPDTLCWGVHELVFAEHFFAI